MSDTPTAPEPPAAPVASSALLLLVSVAGLFLELMFIRWIGSELSLFAHLQNAVLIVCFLGMGMGCWTCRRPMTLRDILAPLLLLVAMMTIFVTWLGLNQYSPVMAFSHWSTVKPWRELLSVTALTGILLEVALAGIIMVLLWSLFVPLGQLLGRLLDDHPHTIRAYSINIAGSLAGIWLFVLLGVLYQPPGAWLALGVAMLLVLGRMLGGMQMLDYLLLIAVVLLGVFFGRPPQALELIWSPYQKLTLELPSDSGRYITFGKYIIRVNNGPYQGMIDLRPEEVARQPERYAPDLVGLSQYDVPLLLRPKPERVLVVGSGSGNDVAGALRGGAGHVTGVDIDAAIIDLGKRLHPEQPYADPARVRVVNDDARSFFANSPDKFDLIIFGLLDAPLQSGAANVHLDNYVYTLESLQRARALLAPGGVLVLTFERLRPFIPERIFLQLTQVFGHEPTAFYIPASPYGWGGVMFVAAENQQQVLDQIAAQPRLAAQIARWQQEAPIARTGAVPVITDDWPYLYLADPYIPTVYYGFAFGLILLFYFGARRLQVTELLHDRAVEHWHFFFLGAAFMLLETQNISKAAVVLGSTWWVNAVIISSILALILLANLIAARWPSLPLGLVYALLLGSCVGLYFLDLAQLAFLPYATKAAAVGLLTSLPMLFSGIVFIRSFAGVAAKDKALGANLFGAMVGGLLQSVTFVTGIKFLLLLVAGLYLAAYLTRPKVLVGDGETVEKQSEAALAPEA